MKASGVIPSERLKPRLPLYEYPPYDFAITSELTNIQID